eukprot:gene788-10517_t
MAAGNSEASRVFSPYRAAGFISNHVPLALQVRGEIQEDNIDLIANHGEYTVTAASKTIKLWKRGKLIKQFEKHKSNIVFMLPFGEHIVSADESNLVNIWSVQDLDVYLTLPFSKNDFELTTALHPSTYLNKIVFGSRQGHMQLWNVKTGKLVYEFNGWSEPIVVLEQAPAIDVAAVGLESGKIVLHNLKYDETLMSFMQEFGPVTSISFRTDNVPLMATGSTSGHVALWDLEKRKVHSCLRDCHSGSVTGMKFLQNQPLMITSGQDNSLKLWIFDNSDGSGRLLKSRTGHSKPPTSVRFYGSSGHIILSAALDRSLRYMSTIRDEQSCEFSQGSLIKISKNLGLRVEDLKLPPITDVDSDPTRSSDWDNVVTCHSGSSVVRTWRLQNRCIGKNSLGKELKKLHGSIAVVARISSCGNFVIVGYSTGFIEKFNLQSGIHRGSFIEANNKAHIKSVKGVVTDSANLLVVSGSSDKTIKYWDFKSHKFISSQELEFPIRQLVLHRDSSLMAVALDDFTVKIIDIDTKRMVRNFVGHQHSITDIAFSPDARWLITAAMDTSIRLWDLPSARLLDCFLVDSPVTSFSFSPTGDFLATCHLDDIGVYLWSNKSLYKDLYLSPLPKDFVPRRANLPTTIITDDESVATIGETTPIDIKEPEETQTADESLPEQISNEIITLSALPASRWRNLLDLKLIKERNKPKEPPQKPKAAPFFLPTIPGLEPKFDTSQAEDTARAPYFIPLCLILFHFVARPSMQDDAVMDLLKEMSPSAIDVELRSVAPEVGGNVDMMEMMLDFFKYRMKDGRDYELVQSYIGLFLKLHGKQIASEPKLRQQAEDIVEINRNGWLRCQELINQSTCLINYFKSATL